MADIRIRREHALGLAKARQITWRWAEEVEQRFGKIRIESHAGASSTWIDGPELVHLVNRWDLVALLAGVGLDRINPFGVLTHKNTKRMEQGGGHLLFLSDE